MHRVAPTYDASARFIAQLSSPDRSSSNYGVLVVAEKIRLGEKMLGNIDQRFVWPWREVDDGGAVDERRIQTDTIPTRSRLGFGQRSEHVVPVT